MAVYRLSGIEVAPRIDLAVEMLTPRPERRWGRVTELAETYSVSRTWLYSLRDQARAALEQVLAPQPPGPKPEAQELKIDRAFVQRAIATLPVLRGSVRGIQQGLKLLFGVQRSVGYISQTLKKAGAAAAAYTARLTVPLPVLAEADEIFQGRRPCLTVVDGRSFLVLCLSPAEARDATTWGVTLLDLEARGVQFQDLASDGGTGLLAGVREAELAIPLRPDLFHLLREAYRLTQRLARAAYRAMDTAERARRAEREAQALQRRRGPRLKVTVPRAQAEVEEAQAMTTHDLFIWLLGEIRQALEPITATGHLVRVAEARSTLETAIELLLILNHADITAFAQKLQAHLEALLAPLAWLEEQGAPWRTRLDSATETFLVWAWQNQQALDLSVETDLPPAWQPALQALGAALALFHRSSSLAEALHSWLRPYLELHRGAPQWLLPLLQLFWNHHPFERGKRKGHSPLELAGVKDAPSLADVFDQLFQSQPTAQPA